MSWRLAVSLDPWTTSLPFDFAETDEFLVEMDEDVEGMQSTIYFLQEQLKEAREQLQQLQEENASLKQQHSSTAPAVKQELDLDQAADSDWKVSSHNSGERSSPSSMSREPVRTPSCGLSAEAARDGTAPESRDDSKSGRTEHLASSSSSLPLGADQPQTASRSQSPAASSSSSSASVPATSTTSSLHETVSTTNGTRDHLPMETEEEAYEGAEERPPLQAYASDIHANHRTGICPPLQQDGHSMDSDVWSPPTSVDATETDGQPLTAAASSTKSELLRTSPKLAVNAETLQNGQVTSATDP